MYVIFINSLYYLKKPTVLTLDPDNLIDTYIFITMSHRFNTNFTFLRSVESSQHKLRTAKHKVHHVKL